MRPHTRQPSLPRQIRQRHDEKRVAEMPDLRSHRLATPHGVFALPEHRLVVFTQTLTSQSPSEVWMWFDKLTTNGFN
jgi:hypothetical protein